MAIIQTIFLQTHRAQDPRLLVKKKTPQAEAQGKEIDSRSAVERCSAVNVATSSQAIDSVKIWTIGVLHGRKRKKEMGFGVDEAGVVEASNGQTSIVK